MTPYTEHSIFRRLYFPSALSKNKKSESDPPPTNDNNLEDVNLEL